MSAPAQVLAGLTRAQAEFLADRTSRVLGFVGGWGSGKSKAGAYKALDLALINAPVPVLVTEPIYPLVRDTLIPTFEEILTDWGAWRFCSLNRATNNLIVRVNGVEGHIWMRSTNKSENLAGPNVGAALIDESGLTSEEAFKQIKARVRAPRAKVRQLACMGTPDQGKRGWFYERLEGDPKPGSRLIRAPTTENYFLPEDWIEDQLAYLDEQERARYVQGLFVDFAGLVYTRFDPTVHELVCDNPEFGEQVMMCDFGYGCMAWGLGRIVGDVLHVTGEQVLERTDTLEATRRLVSYLRDRHEQWYGTRPHSDYDITSKITVYCDPAGTPEFKGSASDTRILQDAGFHVLTQPRHPRIRDRINSVQTKLASNELFVDPIAAPYFAKCLREHAYSEDGWPEKGRPRDGKKALDHGNDATGYLCAYRWPAALQPAQESYYH